MKIIIDSSITSLEKAISLLSNLPNDKYTDCSISPYYSSVGSHIRHILDFYSCIILGSKNSEIDLTARKRDIRIENDTQFAIKSTKAIILELNNFDDLNKRLLVNDNLGLGEIKIEYSIANILAQANSHTIHHYAIINYILDRLGVMFEDEDFGLNPTTPKLKKLTI